MSKKKSGGAEYERFRKFFRRFKPDYFIVETIFESERAKTRMW